MIPWRLQFSGIRDYDPTEMNLDTQDEHVLITGPNGSGKSTITFCMGAVLRSSKVDISGLKSQNLPEDETWRASIRFLFKNDGPARIDGPLYIEFRLVCEQHPNQQVKIHYEIHDGDEPDALELRQIYRSGDVNQNNFTAYERALEYKYKIQPDLYYLIWYQQEVNQFAVMAPEERFRIFSEMHGITKIQKDWEMSLEGVSDARHAYQSASSQQKMHEFDLGIARNKKEQYESNQRRLNDSGFRYAHSTNELYRKAHKRVNELNRLMEDRTLELEDLRNDLHDQQARLQDGHHEHTTLQKQHNLQQTNITEHTEKLAEKEKESSHMKVHVKELAEELSELTKAYQQLSYSETVTKERLEKAQQKLKHFREKEHQKQEKVFNITQQIEDNRQEQSHVQAAIDQWNEQSKDVYALLKRYESSHQLKQRVEQQQSITARLQKQFNDTSEELQQYKDEHDMLKRNQIESPRQKQAIQGLQKQGVKAYPLRYFVRLQDGVTTQNESLFDGIKYTIFYDASSCKPVNDVYHVSLKGLIPERLLTELPTLGLQMREGLSELEENQAARVLWWIDQFFKEEFPKIKNNVLLDKQGIRGAQEENTYILSKKALEQQKVTVEKKIHRLSKEIKRIQDTFADENEKLQIWNSDIRKVEEAEAFLTRKGDQDYRLNHLSTLKKDFEDLQERKNLLEQDVKKYWGKGYHMKEHVKLREHDLSIYKQFGEQSKKINRLQQLESNIKRIIKEMEESQDIIDHTHSELNRLENEMRTSIRRQQSIEHDLEQIHRSINHVNKQLNEHEEERVATVQHVKEYEQELEELKRLIPELVEKAVDQKGEEDSKIALQHIQNQAKVEFDHARREEGIDPYAVENYETLKEEVERKKEELISAKNLLEENEERAEQNEQRLENAIAMQVQKIHLLFEQYMGAFQFEGRVMYEKTFNKKDRPIFKLYIQVRKEGHRGKFEDVSLKARGGRVGKGVSGGEESLSSLLFALSLLQNLENNSSFIVMDEFDSALDEMRKTKVFELYADKLQRKLIIISPKGHENDYYDRFSKAFVVSHDSTQLKSTVKGLRMKKSSYS